jgi:hypothetical protein
MQQLNKALVAAGLVADLDHHEELLMEDDSELNPIQRRIILRRIHKRQQDADNRSETSDSGDGCPRP